MKQSEATEILAWLTGAYPNAALDENSVGVWVESLISLDAEEAAYVAKRWVRTEERFPTPAGFRAAVNARVNYQRRGEEARSRAIESTSTGQRELPFEVKEWMASHEWKPREIPA